MIRWLTRKWRWWHIGRWIAQADAETARYEAALAIWRASPTPKGLPPPMPDWQQERVIPTAHHLALVAAMQARQEAHHDPTAD